jgi:predicted acetyltransferase
MQLVRPASEHLTSYVAALERGWSADNERGVAAAMEELAKIREDPIGFLASLEDREAKGPPVTLPDGSLVQRLPGFRRWMWEDEFVGSIGFRWQPGTTKLPPYCLGHIGYAVVPWKQRRGYATTALKLMLVEAAAVGLPFVEITTDPSNVASQRVIEAAGGCLRERFTKPVQFGSRPGLRYRIQLHNDGRNASPPTLPGTDE